MYNNMYLAIQLNTITINTRSFMASINYTLDICLPPLLLGYYTLAICFYRSLPPLLLDYYTLAICFHRLLPPLLLDYYTLAICFYRSLPPLLLGYYTLAICFHRLLPPLLLGQIKINFSITVTNVKYYIAYST